MTRTALDPSPRSYAQHVQLLQRSRRGPGCAPEKQTIADIKDWLLHEATRNGSVMLMFEEFMWRCQAAGLSIDRCMLRIGTLHPRVIGFSWVWSAEDQICDEIAADERVFHETAFTLNPLSRVIMHGETIRIDLKTEEGANSSPLTRELADAGYTSYVLLPLSASGETYNAMTFATKRPGGFPDKEKKHIRGLIDLLALHVERHVLQRIARNVADTYLGPIAGQRVLDGEIKRGDGEAIDAVVFMADMRDFTRLADQLSGPDVTAILNVYFDRVSEAVLSHGGDILKFMGDGILAVFDQKALGENAAADSAFKAARAALSAIADLNRSPPADLPDPALWHPLKIGIGLHRGEVFFGNVGGEERLDFTVIGRAVNETSRVESLCKPLGRELLLTEPVRDALSAELRTDLTAMGEHALRGVGKPVAIFAA
ncbi:adenylate/guanylate cyclase domain-containing protein [Roseibium sp. Sym1]|uniref:adenylate/guanylate cyclase domain-containing protein n=1 Tax=Roseibium sp. Sym1 TaxID=3016006 RepID=UPI0022B56853|nr:adenylate/guanylate cyclase domain-containing protein [Roseibium sp. Sym1]